MNDRIAVSTWALHRTIGESYPDSPSMPRAEGTPAVSHATSGTPLLELPAKLAAHGFDTVQICHFHVASRSASYVGELRAALADAGVKLHSLLIDDGDITDSEYGVRDGEWIAGWLEVAQALGAQTARVIAGKRPPGPKTLMMSARRLGALADGTSVRLITENWFDLTSTPDAVDELLDRLDGLVGLCADFGNWPRPRKYDDLPRIMRRAEVAHAKFDFVSPEVLDTEDADRCLAIAGNSGFKGPFVLVNGGMGESDWSALDIQRNAILEWAHSPAI